MTSRGIKIDRSKVRPDVKARFARLVDRADQRARAAQVEFLAQIEKAFDHDDMVMSTMHRPGERLKPKRRGQPIRLGTPVWMKNPKPAEDAPCMEMEEGSSLTDLYGDELPSWHKTLVSGRSKAAESSDD
jgi:hypothetical protein